MSYCPSCALDHDDRLHQGRPRASRVRKARYRDKCAMCGGPVNVGTQIGLVATGWAETSCILMAAADTWGQTVPDEPEEPF